MFMPRFIISLPKDTGTNSRMAILGLSGWASRLRPALRRGADRHVKRGILGLEAVLVLALGYVLARLFWALWNAPETHGDAGFSAVRVERAAAADFSVLSRYDVFHRMPVEGGTLPAMEGSAPETALDLRLNGVRTDMDTGQGSAIIRLPDQSQRSFQPGDEIIEGVRLLRLLPDRVVLSRHGVREHLLFPDAKARTRMVEPSVQAESAVLSGDPANLFDHVQATPRRIDGRLQGFLLSPRGDDAVFRTLGLMAGDVLVAVNERPLTRFEDMQEFAERFGGAQRLALSLERQGQIVVLHLAADGR